MGDIVIIPPLFRFLTLHSLSRIARVIKLNNPNCELLNSKYKRSPFNLQNDLQSLATSLSYKPDDLTDLDCQVHCLSFHSCPQIVILFCKHIKEFSSYESLQLLALCWNTFMACSHLSSIFTQMAYFEWDLPWLSYLKWLPFSYLIISFPFCQLPFYHLMYCASRWCSVKESAWQSRRHRIWRLDPWAGKIPWRSKWQPTPVFSPGKSHGQRNLAGYSPWGHKSWT